MSKICIHKEVIVVYKDMHKTTENGEGGFAINPYGGGTLSCRKCQQELPYEDLELYDQEYISVGIPVEMVDGDE